MEQPQQIEHLPLEILQANVTAIRDVNKESPKYQELLLALERVEPGVLINPIIVRTEKDETSGEEVYIIVEGGHRFAAATQLKWDTIPAIVHHNMSRIEAMSVQLRANANRIAQTPASEGKHYHRMLVEDPSLQISDLAELGGTTEETIKSRLRLAKNLSDEASNLVDSKEINLRNAQTLTRLDASLQSGEVLINAQTMEPDEFHKYVMGIKSEISAGKDPKGPRVFSPSPKIRKRVDIEAEIKNGSVATRKFQTPEEQKAFIEGLKYAISMDEETVNSAKEKYDLREQERAKKNAEKKQEIAKRRQEEAEKAAAEAQKVAEQARN